MLCGWPDRENQYCNSGALAEMMKNGKPTPTAKSARSQSANPDCGASSNPDGYMIGKNSKPATITLT